MINKQNKQLAVNFVVHINDLYTVEVADNDDFSFINILPLKQELTLPIL